MNAPDFLDTNVLVYAYDRTNPRKRSRSRELLRKALAGDIVWSAQVLAEFAVTLLHKASPRAKPEQVRTVLDALAPVRVIHQDAGLVRRAVEAHEEYGLHFWDGLIVAAAERAGCARILSEDFNAGQSYFGVLVENPFEPSQGRKEVNRESRGINEV
jgi:predicted nucleic acid-binding protein